MSHFSDSTLGAGTQVSLDPVLHAAPQSGGGRSRLSGSLWSLPSPRRLLSSLLPLCSIVYFDKPPSGRNWVKRWTGPTLGSTQFPSLSCSFPCASAPSPLTLGIFLSFVPQEEKPESLPLVGQGSSY